jgi:hypothetical protein
MSDRIGIAQALYCTAADVAAAWPGFALVAPGEQAALIRTASEKIDEHCRRPFGFSAQIVTDVLDGTGRPTLWLTTRPIISVESVTIDGDALDDADGHSWTFDPYKGSIVRGPGLRDRRFGRRFPTGVRNIVVQYYAGYDAIPARITRAAVWTVRWLHERGRVSGIFKSESIGDYSYTIADNNIGPLPAHVQDLLVGFVQDDAF